LRYFNRNDNGRWTDVSFNPVGKRIRNSSKHFVEYLLEWHLLLRSPIIVIIIRRTIIIGAVRHRAKRAIPNFN
jgi:hypothetical protein